MQAREDPSFHYAADEETGQLLLKGCGELHLEVSASQCPSTLTTATPPPAPRPPPNTHTLRTLYTHTVLHAPILTADSGPTAPIRRSLAIGRSRSRRAVHGSAQQPQRVRQRDVSGYRQRTLHSAR